MSPGGGDSVAADVAPAVPLAGAVEAGRDADVLPALPVLLQATAQRPTAARMRCRLVTTTAVSKSMPGRYRQPDERRRCAR
jgi:hypothetical protein